MSVGEVLARLGDNPLVEREKLERSRSWATPVTMALFGCLLGGFALVRFNSVLSDAPGRLPEASEMAEVAFLTMALQLAVVLALVAPVAAPAVSAERELGTLDVLVLGRLTPGNIVGTKLAASLAYLGMIMVAAAPVLVTVFLYAGLNLVQLALAEALIVASAATLGAVALLLSAAVPRSVSATVATNAAVVLYVGVALVGVGLGAESQAAAESVHPLVFANPFYALHTLLADASPDGEHLGHLVQLLVLRREEASSWGPVVQPWQASLLVQLAFGALCLGAAGRLVGRQRHRSRHSARRRRRADQAMTEPP